MPSRGSDRVERGESPCGCSVLPVGLRQSDRQLVGGFVVSVSPVAVMPEQSTLVITRRCVKVADHVYPLGNICHFGPGTRVKKLVPWRILGVIAFIGLTMTLSGNLRAFGWLVVMCAAGCFVYDITLGKRFGLMLMLNSGKELFFETSDKSGIAAVSDHVYAMLERVDADMEPKQVTVNQNKITIKDTTVTGGLNAGTISGDMRTDVWSDDRS